MFLESLESRTLLSSTTLEPTLDFQINTPPSILIPGVLPRDLIFDPTRNQLLSVQNDTVARYDASSGALVGSILLESSLGQGDITPDGKFLYLTDLLHPRVVKVDLDANTYIAIPTPPSTNGISNIRELAVSSGKVFTSEEFFYSQCCNIIRQIDLATDTFSNSSFTNYGTLALSKYAYFAHNADYSYTALISPQHDYSIINNTLSGLPNRNYGNISSIAVSHDGALHAIGGDAAVRIINSHFDPVTSINIARAALAFDPHRDILYATNWATNQLAAYDTNSWDQLFSIPIDENNTYSSNLAVSDDGRSLFVSTYAGIRILHPGENVQLFHEPLTLTATLALTADGIPSGSISFIDTNTGTAFGEVPIQDGVAALTLDNFEPGSYSIFARYDGDDLFSAADSTPVTFRIQPALTTATIQSPGPNQVTVTLNSRGGAPSSGTVTIYEGNTVVGTGNLSGPSPLKIGLSLAPGIHMLQAVYSGDSEHLATVSSLFRHVVRLPTTLTLFAPDVSTAPGEPFTMLVRLAPVFDGFPQLVTIYQDNQYLYDMALNAPSGTGYPAIINLTAGIHHFSASFAGTDIQEPAVSNEVSHEVIARPVTVSLTAPPKARQFDTRITFSAQAVSGALVPRGQITFIEGGHSLGSGEIASDGMAIYSASNLSLGFHTITVTYTSTNGFASATTDPLTIEVLPNSTKLTLSASTTWSLTKKTVQFSATFSNYATTGQIIFKDGSRTIGKSSLGDGSADLSWIPGAGVHKIIAYFAGNASFPATSASVTITVVPVTSIDLMVVYTPAAARSIGSQLAIRNLITDSVANTNQAFLNSHIPVAIRLVYSDLIQYRESGKFETDLDRLTDPHDGVMDSVHDLRNNYGADLVSLFEGDGDLGGVGWELRSLKHPDSTLGFTVVLAGQAADPYYTLAHELGHNLGATHDAQHAEHPGATAFSNGWRFRGKDGVLYHDIMSYDPGETIPYFSNPRIRYAGVPTGNAATADSARTITLAAPYVAAYRRGRARV